MDRNVKTEEGLVKRPRSGNRRSLPRESWTNQVEFLLATIGSVVGLGNIWRFPFLCYQHGGGAFLIPYMLMLLLCGIASLYMEMAVGQYSRRGPYHMLCQFCPLFKGLGLLMIVVSGIGTTFYIIVVVWSMFYLFKSFHSPFPWQDRALLGYNESFHANASTSAGQVYFHQKMLRISQGISHPGGICWDLLGLLLLAWIAVYFCIFRGIKLAGKVVYFTALFPYCLLLGLLINNCLLPGAWEGISYFIVPRWSKLMNVEVWIQAAGQIFSSLGIGEGVIISFSSYKDFNSVLLRDVLVIVLVNSMTSILSGFVIFSGLGYLSHVYNTPVENIAVDGPGLVFMVYPEVLSTMPLASVWAVSFFFMLFCLGIDSVFANVEMFTTFVMDSCGPYLLQKLHRREFVVLLICLTQMIMGIPYTTQSGMYLFQLMQAHITFFVNPIGILIELVVISWIYGTKRLCANVKEMTGQKPGLFFQICWRFLSPCILMRLVKSIKPTFSAVRERAMNLISEARNYLQKMSITTTMEEYLDNASHQMPLFNEYDCGTNHFVIVQLTGYATPNVRIVKVCSPGWS
uniref:sodium- and chloride-dependent GABA transporter ine-like isoform X2 n=1 Tax=Myxine glutinosa TaxID=7769 RepID=UPI00358E25D0